MIITYGPGQPVSPQRQTEHRQLFQAYDNGTITRDKLGDAGLQGARERGRYVGYDYRAQSWVEVDFYGDDALLDF